MRNPIIALLLLVLAASVHAAQRTFVSTGGGDANTAASCSLVSPCRSFGAALTVTDPNGEIIVLDSGGYGRVTIDRSVAITAPVGVYAGISVFSGEIGIDINTAGIKVALRGLTINGQGGGRGINALAADELHIEGCVVSNLVGTGIGLDTKDPAAQPGNTMVVTIKDTIVRSNGLDGIYVRGDVLAQLDTVRIDSNGGSGILATDGAGVSVREAQITRNDGVGVWALNGVSAAAQVDVSVESSMIADNTINGVRASNSGPVGVRLTVARSHLARHLSPAIALTTSGGAADLWLDENVITGYSANAAIGGTGPAAGIHATRNRTYGYSISLRELSSASVHSGGDNYGRTGGGPAPTSGTIDTTNSMF